MIPGCSSVLWHSRIWKCQCKMNHSKLLISYLQRELSFLTFSYRFIPCAGSLVHFMHANHGGEKALLSIFHTLVYWTATSHAVPGSSRKWKEGHKKCQHCVKPLGQNPFKGCFRVSVPPCWFGISAAYSERVCQLSGLINSGENMALHWIPWTQPREQLFLLITNNNHYVTF